VTGFPLAKLVLGARVNAGRVCAAQTRILVPEARHDEIVGAITSRPAIT